MKDYYNILGVKKNASQDEIRKAFHKLAHKHHPDKGGDEKKFKEVNEAYQILSDKNKRAQYDNFGRVFSAQDGPSSGWDGQNPFGDGSGFSWSWGNPFSDDGPSAEAGPTSGWDFEDLGDMFGDIFGFGGDVKTKKDVRRGRDINIDMEISLEEVLSGANKKFALSKIIVCDRCKGVGAEPGTKIKECFSCRGTGQVQQIKRTIFGSFTRVAVCPECKGEGHKPEKPCNVCRGEGRLRGKEEIEISIPPGVDTNQEIRMEGRGEAGRKGGKPGNLYIRILVRNHPVFARKGDDLYISLPINFSQAALGDEIEAPTLEKKNIILKVPEGAESGKVLRISGKGVPHFSGYGRGNMYVELIVKTPKRMTRKQKELMERLKEEGI